MKRSFTDICAGCGRSLHMAMEIASSGIYNPGGPDFELCIPCWESEEALIDESGNFHPDLLDAYYATFDQKRPKLYNVIEDRWV